MSPIPLSKRVPPAFGLALAFAALLCGCGDKSKPKSADVDAEMGPAGKTEEMDTTPPETIKPRGKPVELTVPLGLPPLPITDGTPMTDNLVALGRKIFYEGNVSADSVTSCGSCHAYENRFSDGRQVALGFGTTRGERNTPSLLNVAYLKELNWDGSVNEAHPPMGILEEQVKFPLEDPAQMSTKVLDVEKKLKISDAFHPLLLKTFGRLVTIKYLLAARAVAAFERTLLSGNSPFDRYYFGKDQNALSPAAIRGWALFRDPKKGNCIACHTVGEKSALFTDGKYHNLGVGVDSTGEGRDLGRFRLTQKNPDRGAFRTPSLRSVAETGPYMHNGSLRTLLAVIDFYAEGGNINPYLDPLIKRIILTDREKEDLVSFLQSLSGDMPVNTGRPTAREEAAAAEAEDGKPDKP
jgi:cytochrome c peroxidase